MQTVQPRPRKKFPHSFRAPIRAKLVVTRSSQQPRRSVQATGGRVKPKRSCNQGSGETRAMQCRSVCRRSEVNIGGPQSLDPSASGVIHDGCAPRYSPRLADRVLRIVGHVDLIKTGATHMKTTVLVLLTAMLLSTVALGQSDSMNGVSASGYAVTNQDNTSSTFARFVNSTNVFVTVYYNVTLTCGTRQYGLNRNWPLPANQTQNVWLDTCSGPQSSVVAIHILSVAQHNN